MAGTFAGYEWLAVDVDHRDWWVNEGSQFTFAHGVSARDLVEVLGVGAQQRSGSADPLDELQFGGKAAADVEGGWAVLFEQNGLPQDSAEPIAQDARVDEAVMVFTNVNSVMQFSHWRDQRVRVSFEFPEDRWGDEPDELLAEMADTTGTTTQDYEEAMDDGTYLARMMKLAERVTGVRLGRSFLQQPGVLIMPGD